MPTEQLKIINSLTFEALNGHNLLSIITLLLELKISLDDIASASDWHKAFPDDASQIKAKVLEGVWFICSEHVADKDSHHLKAIVFRQLPEYLH